MITPDKIIKYRIANAMTQDDLARKLGVSKYTISRWENGKGTPKNKVIQSILDIKIGRSDYDL